MKVFIWKRLERLTGHWHPEGVLVVIAEDLEIARAIIRDHAGRGDYDGICNECDALAQEPDLVVACDAFDRELFLFPDAGCC